MKIFLMAASMRKDSFNKKNIRIASNILKQKEYDVELQEFESFSSPLFNEDLETKEGIPASIQELSQKIQIADAVILSCPEYNGSIPGTLKNTLDWLSRMKPISLKGKPMLLLGASTGAFGAIRGNLHTRVPIEILGAHLYPEYLGLSKAHEAFTADGSLKDDNHMKKLDKILQEFCIYAKRFQN